jgi:hypothetical protein
MQQPVIQPVFAPAALTQNKVVSSRGWYITKIVLGSFSLLTCVIIIGLAAGLVANFGVADDYAWIDFIVAYPVVREPVILWHSLLVPTAAKL